MLSSRVQPYVFGCPTAVEAVASVVVELVRMSTGTAHILRMIYMFGQNLSEIKITLQIVPIFSQNKLRYGLNIKALKT